MKSNTLKDLLSRAGYDYSSYSGRGMYGGHCVAVSTDETPYRLVADMVGAATPEELDELVPVLRGTRTDNMGMQVVVYWPSVKCEDADDREEDE